MEFESREDMLECIRKADNTELGGRKIRRKSDRSHVVL
ncbi:RNA-binding protein [Herbidospora sp. RD11066]